MQLEAFQQQLKTIADAGDDKAIDLKLNQLVDVHSQIIEFVKDLDSLFALSTFVELLLYGMMLLALLYMTSVSRSHRRLRN